MNPAFCPKCNRGTVTLFEPDGRGIIHNLCSVCRKHRPGKPFVTRNEMAANVTGDPEEMERLAGEILP